MPSYSLYQTLNGTNGIFTYMDGYFFMVNVGQHIPYIDIYIYLYIFAYYIYIYLHTFTYIYIYLHINNMLIYVSPLNKQIAPEKG